MSPRRHRGLRLGLGLRVGAPAPGAVPLPRALPDLDGSADRRKGRLWNFFEGEGVRRGAAWRCPPPGLGRGGGELHAESSQRPVPEGPSRKPAFWKSGGSTCAKSVCAASGRPCSRFCFRALRTLFAVDVIVNNLVLILPGTPSVPPEKESEGRAEL